MRRRVALEQNLQDKQDGIPPSPLFTIHYSLPSAPYSRLQILKEKLRDFVSMPRQGFVPEFVINF